LEISQADLLCKVGIPRFQPLQPRLTQNEKLPTSENQQANKPMKKVKREEIPR